MPSIRWQIAPLRGCFILPKRSLKTVLFGISKNSFAPAISGESRAAVALQHRCEALRDRFLADDEAVKNFIDEHTDIDIRRLRELVRSARREREQAKPPKSARELYRLLYAYFDEPLDLMMAEEIEVEEN